MGHIFVDLSFGAKVAIPLILIYEITPVCLLHFALLFWT